MVQNGTVNNHLVPIDGQKTAKLALYFEISIQSFPLFPYHKEIMNTGLQLIQFISNVVVNKKSLNNKSC